jgi:hypothetical protein
MNDNLCTRKFNYLSSLPGGSVRVTAPHAEIDMRELAATYCDSRFSGEQSCEAHLTFVRVNLIIDCYVNSISVRYSMVPC